MLLILPCPPCLLRRGVSIGGRGGEGVGGRGGDISSTLPYTALPHGALPQKGLRTMSSSLPNGWPDWRAHPPEWSLMVRRLGECSDGAAGRRSARTRVHSEDSAGATGQRPTSLPVPLWKRQSASDTRHHENR